METQRIREWADAVGLKAACLRLGVNTTTLSRYMSGESECPGSRVVLLETLIEAWEKGRVAK